MGETWSHEALTGKGGEIEERPEGWSEVSEEMEGLVSRAQMEGLISLGKEGSLVSLHREGRNWSSCRARPLLLISGLCWDFFFDTLEPKLQSPFIYFIY